MKLVTHLRVFSILTALTAVSSPARTWTEAGSGRTLTGDYLRMEGEQAVIRRTDGRVVSIALERLSPADRDFVAGLTKGPADLAEGEYVIEAVAGGGSEREGPATNCRVTQPFGIAFDSKDNMYVVSETSRLVRVDARTGRLSVLCEAKPPATPLGDGGPVSDAAFRAPHNCVMGPDDQLFIADSFNYRVRRYDTASGIIHPFAGTGEKVLAGDGELAGKAGLDGVACLCFSRDFSVLYLGGFGKTLRSVSLATGVITQVPGVAASRAQAVDRKGNIYILAGKGLKRYGRDGESEIIANFDPPLNGAKHVWADANDDVLIADSNNHLIRKYLASGKKVITLAGTGEKGAGGVPGPALHAQLAEPHGVVAHPRTGDIYVADSRNHRVLRLTSKR